MKVKDRRLETIRKLISEKRLGSQGEVLKELKKKGYNLTQATLSRDFRLLKVAKVAGADGQYVYALPNESLYRRVPAPLPGAGMIQAPGFRSICFSGHIGVIKTRPGYAGSIACNIDNADVPGILGTIAGDDTIFIVLGEDVNPDRVIRELNETAEF